MDYRVGAENDDNMLLTLYSTDKGGIRMKKVTLKKGMKIEIDGTLYYVKDETLDIYVSDAITKPLDDDGILHLQSKAKGRK